MWLHVLAMALWFGGLVYQAHIVLPMARHTSAATFAEAARRQRPFAWIALAVVVLTGLYNVTRLGPLDRVMETGAGRLLAGKFILVLLVIPIAAQRDFTQLVRLQLALRTAEDPIPTLRTIAWLDRATILLALVITYLGVAISRP